MTYGDALHFLCGADELDYLSQNNLWILVLNFWYVGIET